MSAIQSLSERISEAVAEDPESAMQIVTAHFVGLAAALAERAGGKPQCAILIDGGDSRDITIHARKPVYLVVSAGVRYWEDASVNGQEDTDGSLIPFRDGELWKPVIRLSDGLVLDWPEGMTASIHYKVCDEGEYWLADAGRNLICRWGGFYVPDDFLCHDNGNRGYGDYIIFNVGPDGRIVGYIAPDIDPERWEAA